MFHITLPDKEKQRVLTPRIPERSGQWEEFKTERVSLAPTIEKCVFGFGKNDFGMNSGFFRAYEVEISDGDRNLIGWKTLYNKDFVQDAPLSQEHWYLKPIVPIAYYEYQIEIPQKGRYLIMRSKEKRRLLSIINRFGVVVSEIDKKKTAVEIASFYRNNGELMEMIKRNLVHREINPDYLSVDFYDSQGWRRPEEYKVIPDYYECVYIESCRTRYISKELI